jgi:5-methylthioadenosine/S-adenosylhomocysteine deaminase
LYAVTVNSPLQTVDTLIQARWILPITPPRTVLEDHVLAISGGAIVDLLPAAAARKRYTGQREFLLADHALIPGLVDLHTRAATILAHRTAGEATSQADLLDERDIADELVYDGTRLACAVMLRGGVTCFNDTYFFPRAAARAAIDSGMRAALGMIVLDSPTSYAADAADYIDKGIVVRDELKDEPLLSFCLAPSPPQRLTDKTLSRIATFAGELDVPIHAELHQSRAGIAASLRDYGMRPLARLARFGLLGPALIAAHAVHLEATEIALLAQHGCHVAHCPVPNLMLGHGIAPLARLLAAGVNVGLGSGSAVPNTAFDLFGAMRIASLVAKGESGDAATLPAWETLELATRRAACALGLDDRVGTLGVGKRADVVAVRVSGLEVMPCYDPVSHIVYAAGRRDVSHVWVDGKAVVEDSQFTRIDTHELQAKASFWRNRMRA